MFEEENRNLKGSFHCPSTDDPHVVVAKKRENFGPDEEAPWAPAKMGNVKSAPPFLLPPKFFLSLGGGRVAIVESEGPPFLLGGRLAI
jgi:hypothetical protein